MMMKTGLSTLIAVTCLLSVPACGSDDGGGGIDAAPSNRAPSATFTRDPTCTTSNTTAVTFTSTATDPDGDALTCKWRFAAGTPPTSTDCVTSGVTFPNQAPYNVTLTVDDGKGGTDKIISPIAPCAQ